MIFGFGAALAVTMLAAAAGTPERPITDELRAAMIGDEPTVDANIKRWMFAHDRNWAPAHRALLEAGFQFVAGDVNCRNYVYRSPAAPGTDYRTISTVWCPPKKEPFVLTLKMLGKPIEGGIITPYRPKTP